MKKFTGEKWKITKPKGRHSYYIRDCGKNKTVITAIRFENEADETPKANARLIAAAPEMYEYLKECIDVFLRVDYTGYAAHVKSLLDRIDGTEDENE